MNHEYVLTLTILKAFTVLAGFIFLSFTLKAYLKHRAPAMLVLLIAIALMTAGALAEGFATQVLGLELGPSHIIEAVFTLAAFVVLVASVLSHRVEARVTVSESNGELPLEPDE